MSDSEAFLSYAALNDPLDLLPEAEREALSQRVERVRCEAGDKLFSVGEEVKGLYLVNSGAAEIRSPDGDALARRGPKEVFGDRSIMRGGKGEYDVVAIVDGDYWLVPAAEFHRLHKDYAPFRRYFDAAHLATAQAEQVDARDAILSAHISELMTAKPIVISPDAPVREAAKVMTQKKISCLPVVDAERLVGILTTGDIAGRIVARDRDGDTPVREAMTRDPFGLEPTSVGFDALREMTERGISHLPVLERGKLVGILTATNLSRRRALTGLFLTGEIAKKSSFEDLASVIARAPQLLASLVDAGMEPATVGRIMTSLSDALTRRLIDLAEARLGAPPIPYLWLACGSQGRQEQTGVSDQDNCLIFDDAFSEEAHGPYFEALASFVSDGLDAAGYYYCPGEMMATAPRWRQPLKVWRGYFKGWIDKPDPMAQMLASVMFDLRPIAGETSLFDGLVEETLDQASKNSIFRAHMASNSLKHTPPLGLFGGVSTIRKGEHKDTIDLKLNGVVPIVDLARIYSLVGAIPEANTRRRLELGIEKGSVSASGGRDLIDAYDLIAGVRLRHQAAQIRGGAKPDNFVRLNELSEFEGNHLRNAFAVVKTMQSALGKLVGTLG